MRFYSLSMACLIGCVSAWLATAAPAQSASEKAQTENKSSARSTAEERAAASTDRGAAASSGRPVADPRPSRTTARSKGDITFDDLKFDIEKGGAFDESMLTKEIKALHKQTVRLRGYMLPNSVYKSSGIEQFVLVRDNMECCFGPGAAIYDCVLVNMEKGKTTDFTTKPIAVRGKFEIEEFKFPDGTLAAIYKMTASEAK